MYLYIQEDPNLLGQTFLVFLHIKGCFCGYFFFAVLFVVYGYCEDEDQPGEVTRFMGTVDTTFP